MGTATPRAGTFLPCNIQTFWLFANMCTATFLKKDKVPSHPVFTSAERMRQDRNDDSI